MPGSLVVTVHKHNLCLFNNNRSCKSICEKAVADSYLKAKYLSSEFTKFAAQIGAVHISSSLLASNLMSQTGMGNTFSCLLYASLTPTLNCHLEMLADCLPLTAVPSRGTVWVTDAGQLGGQYLVFPQLLNTLFPATCFAQLLRLWYLSCVLAPKFLEYLYVDIYKHASHINTEFSGYLKECGNADFHFFCMNAY